MQIFITEIHKKDAAHQTNNAKDYEKMLIKLAMWSVTILFVFF